MILLYGHRLPEWTHLRPFFFSCGVALSYSILFVCIIYLFILTCVSEIENLDLFVSKQHHPSLFGPREISHPLPTCLSLTIILRWSNSINSEPQISDSNHMTKRRLDGRTAVKNSTEKKKMGFRK